MKNSNITVIAVGGSLIVPHLSDSGGIDVSFLKRFRDFLLKETKKGRQFVVVAGGGRTARLYCRAASEVTKVSDWNLHWLGIHATMLNAHLLQTLFMKEAHEWIIDEEISSKKAKELLRSKKKVYIASGWRPGPSTDHVAVRLAERFGAKDVIIAGDTPYVYDKDPRKFKNAKPILDMKWADYQDIVPRTRKANDSAPVDPIATKLAKKLKLEVRLIRGTNMKNFASAIEGKKFTGTIIR